MERVLTKHYYSIGEVANMFDVSTSLLRFWEKDFPQVKPKKNSRGDRQFTQKDIETIDIIYDLVKIKGYTHEGAQKELKRLKKGSINDKTIILRLKAIKKGLTELKKDLKLDD